MRAVETFKTTSIRTGIAVSIPNLVIKFLTFVVVDYRVHCSLLHKLRAQTHCATARAVTCTVQLSPGASVLEPILDRPNGRRTLGAANAYRHTSRALRLRWTWRTRRGAVCASANTYHPSHGDIRAGRSRLFLNSEMNCLCVYAYFLFTPERDNDDKRTIHNSRSPRIAARRTLNQNYCSTGSAL